MAYSIDIYKNQNFALTVTAKDCAGVPMDLDVYEMIGKVKRKYSDTGYLSTFDISDAVPANSGIFTVSLGADQTADLPEGQWVYSVDAHLSGAVINILNGYANVNPAVSTV